MTRVTNSFFRRLAVMMLSKVRRTQLRDKSIIKHSVRQNCRLCLLVELLLEKANLAEIKEPHWLAQFQTQISMKVLHLILKRTLSNFILKVHKAHKLTKIHYKMARLMETLQLQGMLLEMLKQETSRLEELGTNVLKGSANPLLTLIKTNWMRMSTRFQRRLFSRLPLKNNRVELPLMHRTLSTPHSKLEAWRIGARDFYLCHQLLTELSKIVSRCWRRRIRRGHSHSCHAGRMCSVIKSS